VGRVKTIASITCSLKKLEHRKLGWKVLISKYDLGKSLSKEMWCKMADTKTCFYYIFKKMKNALMSHYGFRFWNISKILCGLCRSICMWIFSILKLVISLKARKRFWFYLGKKSLFHVSLAQFCIFLIQSCIEVTSLWARVWHNMMHRCLIHKRAQYNNYIQIFCLCFDLFKNVPRFFVITATTTQILRK